MGKIYLPLCGLTLLFLFSSCQPSQQNEQKEPLATTDNIVDTEQVEKVIVKTEEQTFDEFSLDYLMGKFDPAKHEDFVVVDSKYTRPGTFYLRKDTYEAFQKMYEAALKEGVKLKILSATRNFDVQKSIWEAKWTGKRILSSGENAKTAYPNHKDRALKILEYSSMPSTSRHHWGTDVDFNALNNKFFESGEGAKIYAWLQKNASSFGFCQPYTPKGEERPFGYNEEKWHWSYIPVAKKLTDMAANVHSNEAITGFQAAETAVEIDVVKKYVLGINEACK